MLFLYTDETNLDPTYSDFFIYGGIAVPADRAESLSNSIDKLRQSKGYDVSTDLKFNSAGLPANITPQIHRDAKKELLKLAVDAGCILLVSIIHHNVATNPNEARKKEINRVCYHFNLVLNKFETSGFVFLDNFSDPQLKAILREKFMVGVTGMPYSGNIRLKHVLGFNLSSIGSSNFASLVDIALGTVRYAINERNDPTKANTTSSMLRQLEPLFLKNSNGKIAETSLFFSPKVVKIKSYLEDYTDLHTYLASNGIDAESLPKSTRTY